MLCETQRVKSWPLEKYAKFIATDEAQSSQKHNQGYWKVWKILSVNIQISRIFKVIFGSRLFMEQLETHFNSLFSSFSKFAAIFAHYRRFKLFTILSPAMQYSRKRRQSDTRKGFKVI